LIEKKMHVGESGESSGSDQVQHHLHGTKTEKKSGCEESDLLFGISH
jgi:hypothetical protein|tara:strand:+ start:238 stop:378 length:141 start_codon:yes stop_codon:yes gene_type:complete